MIYQSFAQLYDQLFDETLYKDWRDYTLKRCPAGSLDVLDLAGGAGRLGVLLAQAGLTVTVADFSTEMLTIASQHAQEAGVALNLVEADMRDLQAFPQYDLVTCYADSLCYLPNLADVKTTLGEVKKHLKAGGRLLFDVITPYQTDQVYPGYMYNYQDDDHERACMWQSFADDDVEHGVIHDLTFFNRLPDGNYQRVGETHFERSYPQSRLIDAVKQAGFKQVTVTTDFGRQAPDETTTRWFFECQK